MLYRQLATEEIDLLISQGCHAPSWSEIEVTDGFTARNIINSRFEGKVRIGDLSGTIFIEKKTPRVCGIYNSFIRNCDIGNRIYISDVKDLSHYIVEDNVAVETTGSLVVTSASCFGNGTEIEVLNEGGGRELPIFDRLSSQIAYLAVLYRHDRDFTGSLLGMIKDYCEKKRSDYGLIKSGARISNCQVIQNVNIGSHAMIAGASLLQEGTICSSEEAPAIIGEGVIAKRFIILEGSKVDGGAIIEKSFIGQGVKMGKQYSAENSAFFANSEAFHGEACSIFAGPYTVTHHKSTLMIASLFSFFNAGSGTNQSNHMYKLGPVHQGIMERGSKTGSFGYLLLPCHVGAFTVVMGKHYSNFDTSDFPFSYISEEKGKSELTPAMNIFTVGTRRDSEKWRTRDRRTGPDKLDLIHFDLYSPYIVARMINGINILNDLLEKTDRKQDFVNYKGINIHRLLFKTSRKYYEMGLKIAIGQQVVTHLKGVSDNASLEDIRRMLVPHGDKGTGKWVEISGLFAPAGRIKELMDDVKSGEISSIDDLNMRLFQIYNSYADDSWTWFSDLISQQTGRSITEITADDLTGIISEWKTSFVKLNNMIIKDAEKEFDSTSRIGFGIDGNDETRDLDFLAVRGILEENKFTADLHKESAGIEAAATDLLQILERCKS